MKYIIKLEFDYPALYIYTHEKVIYDPEQPEVYMIYKRTSDQLTEEQFNKLLNAPPDNYMIDDCLYDWYYGSPEEYNQRHPNREVFYISKPVF